MTRAPTRAGELRHARRLLDDRDARIAALTEELATANERNDRELRTAQRIQPSAVDIARHSSAGEASISAS